jgi:hypothetical protein
MSYRDSGYSVHDLGIEPDEYVMHNESYEDGDDPEPTLWDERDDDEPKCTCTYGAYVKYAGGTGFDISEYDPECPIHGT